VTAKDPQDPQDPKDPKDPIDSNEPSEQEDVQEPVGPRDQAGFDHLTPHPDHPIASQEREKEKARKEEEDAARQKAQENSTGEEDPPSEDDTPEKQEGFLDHLEDLRRTLIDSAIAAAVASVIGWFISSHLLDLLIIPIKEYGVYFTAPNEAFLTRLKLSGAMGLFVVAPFIFFKFYMFVMPGLHKREKKVVTPLLIATTLLFYTGVAFAFLIVIPQIIPFFMSFGTEVLSPLIGVGAYFALVSRLCLAFGLVFQLPLLVLFLSAIGVVKPQMLLRTWRIAIVGIFILSAFLTPADIPSQLMMAGPVLVLYFSSVLVAKVVTVRKDKED